MFFLSKYAPATKNLFLMVSKSFLSNITDKERTIEYFVKITTPLNPEVMENIQKLVNDITKILPEGSIVSQSVEVLNNFECKQLGSLSGEYWPPSGEA